MKKLNFEKLKGKKGAYIGLVFFVGLFAMGAILFAGGSISEVPQLVDTVPVPPSDAPSGVTNASDPGSQDNSGISESGSGFVVKKYSTTTNRPASVQAATVIHNNQPYPDGTPDTVSDDDEITDPDEDYVDPDDIIEVNDTDISDEEPIPDDDDEFVDDDDTQGDDDTGGDDVIEEPDEEDVDPGDVNPVDDDEQTPDDLPSDEELDDWINS